MYLITEGKTKKVYQDPDNPGHVTIVSKNDITAGDGAKRDTIKGKAEWATTTTVNVFRLLKQCGIKTAFVEQFSPIGFAAKKCIMIPYEVVVRRELHGSALKREPWLKKGHYLPQLRVEFFLKTTGRQWRGQNIPVDDPYIVIDQTKQVAELYRPDQPLYSQEPFLVTEDFPIRKGILPTARGDVLHRTDWQATLADQAKRIFLVLEKQWALLGRTLLDFKLEFGVTDSGNPQIVLADVVDSDSWRLSAEGQYQDKQVYRDGGELDEVAEKYRRTAELTERFGLPKQQIIIWRASEKDDINAFLESGYDLSGIKIATPTGSLHKEPVHAYSEINRLIQETPHSFLIVYCGRSNGAGPTLSAQVTIPAITVPAGWKDFPEDVWSSLRTPSQVPVATVLEPKNAILHALQSLAQSNPRIYAALRFEQEKRLYNL
jgi:phosphoribosylaminoimidazole-succinocarboxamide synthase/phosphoribosylcarboxyaminoimidazole (NCAIR) mutase